MTSQEGVFLAHLEANKTVPNERRYVLCKLIWLPVRRRPHQEVAAAGTGLTTDCMNTMRHIFIREKPTPALRYRPAHINYSGQHGPATLMKSLLHYLIHSVNNQ